MIHKTRKMEQVDTSVSNKKQEKSKKPLPGVPLRKSGRPKKADGPSFPVDEVDYLLVHGEPNSLGNITYPSFRDLGRRFNVAHGVIAQYARSHDCLGRRIRSQEKVRRLADEKITERRAEKLAIEEMELLRMLDRYFLAFEEALKEGKVRADDPGAFNTMVRLRAFLLANLNQHKEKGTIMGVPIEVVEKRYNEYKEQGALMEAIPELTGMVKVVKH